MHGQGVFLDQFGVLHDGQAPYPGAVDAVRHMHESGLKVILLSNSSQRAMKSYERLERMGFQRDWIAGMDGGDHLHNLCASVCDQRLL